ncbi:hypothetical protein ACFLU6_06050 [Acidobacteriota bacterium]
MSFTEGGWDEQGVFRLWFAKTGSGKDSTRYEDNLGVRRWFERVNREGNYL